MRRSLIILGILVGLVVIGGGVWLAGKNSRSASLEKSATVSSSLTQNKEVVDSQHPWPMFHGTADHRGYAKVTGPNQANLKWRYLVGKEGGITGNSVVISQDKVLYVAGGGKITALNLDGQEKWTKSYSNTQGPALSEDGKNLYFLSGNSIVAVNAQDGSELWKYETGGQTIFGPTIGSDGSIYQGSWDKNFYALNSDGSLKWKYQTEGAISYPASIDKDGLIYLGGGDAHSGPDSNLYAFNSNGELKWKYDSKATRVGSPAIGPDGLIYVPAAPTMFVLDSEGKLQWKKGPEISLRKNGFSVVYAADCGAPPLPPCKGQESNKENQSPPENPSQSSQNKDDIAGIISPAIAADGTIYIGNSQGVLSAIDPKSQEIKWTYQTGADPKEANFYGLPSFPLVDKEGTVYVGSVDGKMYALDKNGKLKWDYQTAGRITEASPAFDNSGNLYFTSEDGYLYAIGE